MNLTSLQLRVLVKLANPGRMTVDRLVEAVMPRKIDREKRSLCEPEIRLQIDLLTLHGLITCIDQNGERFCSAAPNVVRWLAKNHPRASRRNRKKRFPFALPVLTASLAMAAGCTHAPTSPAVASAPAPVVTRYNAEGTPPPDRMEQFYNPRTGNMVYRFCVGAECPKPTPKRPLQPRSVVTEINPDGSTEPVAQVAVTAPEPAKKTVSKPKATASKNDNGASLLKAPVAKTAANDKTAAAVTEQLNTLRATAQGAAAPQPAPTAAAPQTAQTATTPQPAKTAAAIGAAAAAAAAAAPKPSVKEAMAPRPVATPTAKPLPKVDEEAPVVVPTTEKPMRVPSSPSANAAPLDGGLKMARAAAEPVGAEASPAMTTSVPAKTVVASGAESSAEQFVATWARLWSDKATDAYFSLYAPDFWPTYGAVRDVAAWRSQRRSVMERQGEIKVTVDVVKVTENEGKAAVRFWQNYESPSFRSRVLKVVDLAKADGEWRIRRERLIPVEPATASA
ncbi:MAG: hypothetical protein KAX55_02040 [Propionivibrio sp.]|nr:hypothetical protein [Propionivibrio sp.]